MIAAVLLILHTFFVAAGISVSRSRSSRVRELAEESAVGAPAARLILSKAEKHFLSVQIGAFSAAFLLGILSLIFVSQVTFAGDSLGPWGAIIVDGGILLFIALAAVFFAQVGKALALSEPERMLCSIGFLVLLITQFLTPFSFIVSRVVSGFLKLLKLEEPLERELAVSAEDISEIVEMSSKAGVLEEGKREMIQGVFSFSDTVVREVMTPRSDIISIHESATLPEVVALFSKEGVSRVIVTGDDLDQVRGVVLGKDMLSFVGRNPEEFKLAKIMRGAYFIPNTKKVEELLEEFRRAAMHFAVVLDEHGSVDGVVTLEDVIEEIVGEIFDEYDHPAEEVKVRKTKSGDLLVAGGLLLADLNAHANLDFPSGEYDTIAGFVIHLLGRIPKMGDIIEHEGLKLRVEGVNQNRVTLVRIITPKKALSSSKLKVDSFETKPKRPDSNKETGEKPQTAGISSVR